MLVFELMPIDARVCFGFVVRGESPGCRLISTASSACVNLAAFMFLSLSFAPPLSVHIYIYVCVCVDACVDA